MSSPTRTGQARGCIVNKTSPVRATVVADIEPPSQNNHSCFEKRMKTKHRQAKPICEGTFSGPFQSYSDGTKYCPKKQKNTVRQQTCKNDRKRESEICLKNKKMVRTIKGTPQPLKHSEIAETCRSTSRARKIAATNWTRHVFSCAVQKNCEKHSNFDVCVCTCAILHLMASTSVMSALGLVNCGGRN